MFCPILLGITSKLLLKYDGYLYSLWRDCLLDYQGGKILTGGSVLESEGNFVQPTIVEISSDAAVVKEELFGPVLYVMKFQVVYYLYLCIYRTYFPVNLVSDCNWQFFLRRILKKQLPWTIPCLKDWVVQSLHKHLILYSNGSGKYSYFLFCCFL
jgi:hypothetical protein